MTLDPHIRFQKRRPRCPSSTATGAFHSCGDVAIKKSRRGSSRLHGPPHQHAVGIWVCCLLPFLLFLNTLTTVNAGAGCAILNNCNGHGLCRTSYSSCECFVGWGASTDIAEYKAPDCSLRICPSGRAWGDVPTGTNTAHALAECSGRGTCDRGTGVCKCNKGFSGDACQRMDCIRDCSGHGQCMSMKQLATIASAMPLSNVTTYTGYSETTTWDEDMIYGCLCDSSWTVGLGSGETQEAEYFGPDCGLRHCPSGDDPETPTVNKTDCHGVLAKGGRGTGRHGNLCQVDCSNRGLCDYVSGSCSCFDGYYGPACNLKSVLAYSK